MSKVIDITAMLKNRTEPLFFNCGCGGDTGFGILVTEPKRNSEPLINSVICLDCLIQFPVANGFIEAESQGGAA